MKISAVIPAYNSEKTIARAIDSVLKQTRSADEIIVIDDGSKDKTAEIVGSYGDKVVLIRQENAGVSVARNAGIDAASSDWIAFLDADDEWLPEKLKLQTEHLEKHPDLKWTYTNLSWKKQEKKGFCSAHPLSLLPERVAGQGFFEDYFQGFAKGFFASTITLLIDKTVFEKAGRFEPEMKRAQDTDLWFRIAYQYPQIGYLSESLAIYHLDTPGSSTKINDDVDFVVELLRRHLGLSKQFGRQDAFRPCAALKLQVYIRQFLKESRRRDALALLRQFKKILPVRFHREMYFRIFLPGIGPAITDAYFWLKRKRRDEN